MALDSIPPWLDVTPAQFGQAAAEGQRLQLSRAELAQRAQEENARLQQSAAATAAQLGLAQQRLAASEKQMAMQSKLREEMIAANFQRAQTQSAVTNAYHEAMIGLGKQRLADTAAKTTQAHQDAALALADSQNLAMFVAGGGSIAEGMAKYPRANPRTVSLLRGDTGRTETVTRRTDVPATPATPATPAEPASKGYLGGWLFGLGAHPAIPAKPEVPATLKGSLTEQVKVPVGSSPAQAFGAATRTNAPPAAVTKQFTDKSGAVYNYTGTSDDPMKDRDPSHWEPASQ